MNIFINYILPIYLFISIICSIIDLTERMNNPPFKYPLKHLWSLYEYSSMNYVSCVILYVMWRLITPLTALVMILYWITHIGRRD